MIDPMGGSLSAIYIGNTRASAVYVGSTKVWPDSAPVERIFNIQPSLCTMCGACQGQCPVDAITFDAQGRIASIDESICVECGTCELICSSENSHAISYV